jgi:hypothetical protein
VEVVEVAVVNQVEMKVYLAAQVVAYLMVHLRLLLVKY